MEGKEEIKYIRNIKALKKSAKKFNGGFTEC